MDLKSLNKKRGTHKSKLTQFTNYLNSIEECQILSKRQITELKCRLSKMEELYSEYDSVQSDIEALHEIPDEQYKEREVFESQYFAAMAQAQEVLARDADASASHSAVTGSTAAFRGGPTLKLPTINLPIFSGQYEDWLEFHDTFSSLIHSDNSIPNINKFHYLRASLTDSAALLIRSLDFSSENYIIAWDLLCDRYNNNRLLVKNHIQAIFNIEPLSRESPKALRNIIDTVSRNLRALKTLKLPTEHWDILIIYIVSNKFDVITSRAWETYRNTLKELPTLADFNTFLKNRSDLLETVKEAHNSHIIRRRFSDVTHNRHKSLVIESRSPPSKSTYICPLCKNNHAIYHCARYRSLPLDTKIMKARMMKLCLNCLRQGHSASSCRLGPCRICNKPHNTLLHPPTTHSPAPAPPPDAATGASAGGVALCAAPPPPLPPTPPCAPPGSPSASHLPSQTQSLKCGDSSCNVTLSAVHNTCVLLSTALIQVTDRNGKKHTIRALLDNGSTSSFITEGLCSKLNLPTHSTSTLVEGLNSQSSNLNKCCDVVISSLLNNYTENINCYVVPRITQLLPTTEVNYESLNLPQHITLADPTFYLPSQIDMLLGADIFWNILNSKNICLGKNKPTLSSTKFGWLISGPILIKHNKNNTIHCNHSIISRDDQLNNQLTQFFELETVSVRKHMSNEEIECEQSFIKNTLREPDGRFQVTIPLKESPEKLGDSYTQALSRFLSLESKLARNPLLKKQYCQFMQEYITLGHMTENKYPEKDEYTYLMPHHGVLRQASLSTKLRVVFDASAVTSSGVSFNNLQLVGPVVQNDLISILIRIRQHKFAVTADVEKMYRMINVNSKQRQLQQILWRFEPTEELKQYLLNTVTYGTACAPYLATRCLIQLGKECSDSAVAEVIINDFYVDDLITGASSEAELVEICRGVTSQLSSAHLYLRKWFSNNPKIINQVVGASSTDGLLNLSNNEFSKTLGLLWSCKEDKFIFNVNPTTKSSITKRTILSIVSQIFDPLGLINPCILVAKVILQKLWSSKYDWDEDLPSDICDMWSTFLNSLNHIKIIKIPRYVLCDLPFLIELHIFSDASMQAYSACVYLKSVSNKQVSVHLIAAKSRVSPIKPMTMPRLELCGALLATRLTDKVKSSFRLKIDSYTYWCDSTIVLGWIKSPRAHLLKPFVYNRIKEITENSDPSSWRYIPTNANPADIGSRGADAKQLESCDLWWQGPTFLSCYDNSNWPSHPSVIKDCELPEFKVQCHVNTNISESYFANIIKRFSNLIKLQRVIAYVHRFINNCRSSHKIRDRYLKVNELTQSFNSLCRLAQIESFSEEYTLLKQGKGLPSKNRLLNLNPFFNTDDSLLRVGGRLSNSFYDYDTKHPILLHSSHHLTKLIYRHYHMLLLHAGPQLLLATSRHKVWVLGGRNLARKIVHDCIKCCRFSGKVKQPIMGNLPEQRLHADYPFSSTAIDYAGPIMILNRKGRGSTLIKSYLCIFICLAIKAVHIELVTDLSTDSFLSALHRFIARRGKPLNIFSDNGKCFVGACNELSKFLKHNSDIISSEAANLSINFNFSPAYSPHFNGLAEGCVKSFKFHLKRVLALSNLTYEEMNTVLVQIEGILNSRPLIPTSSDPSDLTALTPSHFLIGRTLTVLPSPQIKDAATIPTLSRYMRMQQLKLHFWSRFYKEYITELQTRQKWQRQGDQLRVNELVLVKDDRLPPNRWLLGRVTRLFPGSDGIARVADVLTTSGTVRRAFNRLCPLPMEDHNLVPGRQDVNASHVCIAHTHTAIQDDGPIQPRTPHSVSVRPVFGSK
ncbi:hypothetical protein ABMA27_001541 [Loxostege sticticalis]|uniref:Integrase catalytic domain-containing protein n=2 Tax=Loxostege sticticalis TaxID=481309 RepID=A0ABR3HYV9_LOXSC